MNRDEYFQLVGLIRTNYANLGAWEDAENYSLFLGLDADPVFESYDRLRSSGRYDDFPPKPPGVARLATELLHNQALPAPVDDEEVEDALVGWKEGRVSLGYDGLSVWEAARERHREMFESFEMDCRCPSGAHIACHSKDCDIHALIV